LAAHPHAGCRGRCSCSQAAVCPRLRCARRGLRMQTASQRASRVCSGRGTLRRARRARADRRGLGMRARPSPQRAGAGWTRASCPCLHSRQPDACGSASHFPVCGQHQSSVHARVTDQVGDTASFRRKSAVAQPPLRSRACCGLFCRARTSGEPGAVHGYGVRAFARWNAARAALHAARALRASSSPCP